MRLAPWSPGDIRLPLQVYHHAAAGVVRGRHHGQRLACHIETEFQAAGVDGGEVLPHEVLALVRDVEIDAVDAEPLHLVVDGAGDDVPRREFCLRVEAVHEALAVREPQDAPLTAHGLGDEKALGARVIEAGGVELVELEIGHAASGAPGHGDAIARRGVGVGGVEIGLARTSRSQHHEACREEIHRALLDIQHIGPAAATLARDQVDGDVAFEDLDVRMTLRLFDQRVRNRASGRIGRVDDAAMAVAAFHGQVEVLVAIGRDEFGEAHAKIHQPLDALAAVAHSETHDVLVAESGACLESVLDVCVDAVGVVEHGGDAALRPGRGPFVEFAFADHGDAPLTRYLQRHTEAGCAAADDQNVVGISLRHRLLRQWAAEYSTGVRGSRAHGFCGRIAAFSQPGRGRIVRSSRSPVEPWPRMLHPPARPAARQPGAAP
jgi:hypothetical protein